jgi:uncharacterized membrane protein
LNLYRRLAETRTLVALDELTLEMLDRFGQLPEPAVALFELRRLRILGAGPPEAEDEAASKAKRDAPSDEDAKRDAGRAVPWARAGAAKAQPEAPKPAAVESLRVIQQSAEITLRRPLRPGEIRTLVGMLNFQVEFFSGREFGLRVRGEGLALLNRTRELLEAVHVAGRAR